MNNNNKDTSNKEHLYFKYLSFDIKRIFCIYDHDKCFKWTRCGNINKVWQTHQPINKQKY